ncbi:hypothetical protein [Mycobacterium neglectum]|uniref:hypothetical protein n=1 Tax=Mycobacterium neglectum TaxID=242737 RepID=UPI001FEA1274|nr:hypothetical protein [Mycobacterium neglectum]
MSYSATITDPHEADAMPMWESFGHADVDAALQAAQTYIHATQPGDRIVAEGQGVYAVWTGPAPSTRVATVVIAPADDHPCRARPQDGAPPCSPPSPLRSRARLVESPEMTTVFVATVRTAVEYTAVAHTAERAARLACGKGMEYLQSVHGDLGYDDPMLVGKYFGVDVIPFEVGGPAQETRRSTLLAP